MLARLYAAALCAAALTSVPCLAADLGQPPAAGELLVELAKITQSPEQPGVYAWSERGGWRRVVVCGRRPRWSPDRTKFIYWVGSRLWTVRLARPDPSPLIVARGFHDSAIEWLPNGDELAGCYDGVWDPNGACLFGRLVMTLGGRNLYSRSAEEQSGRFSLASDGRQIAYECVNLAPGLGAVESVVRVAWVGTDRYRDIASPALEGCCCYNPRWQPGGPWVAFDAFQRKSGRRQVMLWHSETGEIRQARFLGLRNAPDWSVREQARLVAWSPDSKTLCVWMTPNPGATRVGPSGIGSDPFLLPMDANAPVQIAGGIATAGDMVCAAWSPDSQRLAVLRSHRRPTWASEAEAFGIYQRAEGGQPGRWLYVEPPPGLQVVDMDW